jgi:Flp pilus assembly protein TadG
MVEFAVASTVLLMTMIGIMQTSIMLYTFHLISEAAREGTRYAMVRGNTCAVSGSSCTATVAQIQSYVQNLGLPGIDPSKMTVTPTYSAYPAGGSCTPNANCANPGDLVTVKVVYAYELNIPFVPSNSLNMTSTSAMVISQ